MAEVAKTLEELRKVKGWERFPLPECVYKEFNIEKPKQYDGIMDYMKDAMSAMFTPSENPGPVEVRPPAEGGLREVGEAPPVPIHIEPAPPAGGAPSLPNI